MRVAPRTDDARPLAVTVAFVSDFDGYRIEFVEHAKARSMVYPTPRPPRRPTGASASPARPGGVPRGLSGLGPFPLALAAPAGLATEEVVGAASLEQLAATPVPALGEPLGVDVVEVVEVVEVVGEVVGQHHRGAGAVGEGGAARPRVRSLPSMDPDRQHEIARAAGLDLAASVQIAGADPVLPARFPIGEVAAVALGWVGDRAAELAGLTGDDRPVVHVGVGHAAASLLGFGIQQLDGQTGVRTNHANPLVALHRAGDDRWIHLHGGFPGLAAGTCEVLGLDPTAEHTEDRVASAVGEWRAADLEDTLAAAGMCGAMVRSHEEWLGHEHGRVADDLPTVRLTRVGGAVPADPDRFASSRPLEGLRVLDLTRVLAGPTCGRTLAALGAEVLSVRAEHLPSVPIFVIDTGHGKRSTFLDLRDAEDRRRFEDLLAEVDVLVQGYRPGVMERLGLSAAEVMERRPGIVCCWINAYGPEGPWRDRPGWEQLAQSAGGIAHAQGEPGQPALVPAAASDYTTGYLAAGGVVDALARQSREGGSWLVEASLSQTVAWLTRLGPTIDPSGAAGFGELDMRETETADGTLTHLGPGLAIDGLDIGWERPPPRLGEHDAAW